MATNMNFIKLTRPLPDRTRAIGYWLARG